VLTHQPRHGVDRHGRDQRHDQRLEQQGEPAARARPWHADLPDPASGAAHARHTGVQIGLVLEEVEMAPRHRFGVVDRAVGSTTARAGEAAAGGEVDVDVQAPGRRIELAAGDRPWRHNAQRQLQQTGILHDGVSTVAADLPERGAVLAAVKDAARRCAVACGHS
jgi:hypothetical protein